MVLVPRLGELTALTEFDSKTGHSTWWLPAATKMNEAGSGTPGFLFLALVCRCVGRLTPAPAWGCSATVWLLTCGAQQEGGRGGFMGLSHGASCRGRPLRASHYDFFLRRPRPSDFTLQTHVGVGCRRRRIPTFFIAARLRLLSAERGGEGVRRRREGPRPRQSSVIADPCNRRTIPRRSDSTVRKMCASDRAVTTPTSQAVVGENHGLGCVCLDRCVSMSDGLLCGISVGGPRATVRIRHVEAVRRGTNAQGGVEGGWAKIQQRVCMCVCKHVCTASPPLPPPPPSHPAMRS